MNTKKLIATLSGGAVVTLFTTIPGLNFINCFCCAGILAGGILSVYLLQKFESFPGGLSFVQGIELGLLTGVFATILTTLVTLVFPWDMYHTLLELTDNLVEPIVVPWPESLEPFFAGPGFSVLAALSALVTNTLFGMVGGILGVWMYGEKQTSPTSRPSDDSDDDIFVEEIKPSP